VKIGGEPILNVPSAGSFQSGITFAMTAAGLVAPFEEHEARVTAGYNLLEWRSLDPHDRALEVAHFRLRNARRGHEEALAAERAKSKAKGRRSK